jgi:hypothetical protein
MKEYTTSEYQRLSALLESFEELEKEHSEITSDFYELMEKLLLIPNFQSGATAAFGEMMKCAIEGGNRQWRVQNLENIFILQGLDPNFRPIIPDMVNYLRRIGTYSIAKSLFEARLCESSSIVEV